MSSCFRCSSPPVPKTKNTVATWPDAYNIIWVSLRFFWEVYGLPLLGRVYSLVHEKKWRRFNAAECLVVDGGKK